MTWEQFLEWAAFYELDPWERQRDDLRMEVFLARLCGILSGETSGLPAPLWPHAPEEEEDPALALARIKLLDAHLVWDGKRHVWKEGAPPDLSGLAQQVEDARRAAAGEPDLLDGPPQAGSQKAPRKTELPGTLS